MHVVLRGAEVILYKRKEDTDMAFRLGLKGAAIQRSTHPDFKFILLLREAAPMGSKASALLGMTAEPLLLAAKNDEELGAWFTAVQTACAAIDTGRCQYIRSIESGCRGVSALLEAEGRVWIASAEKPVLRVFDYISGAFKFEIAYQPPDPASTDVISCLWYVHNFHSRLPFPPPLCVCTI